MASITGELFCCDDCLCAIANSDTSGMDYYGPEYRAEWERGVEASASEFPDGSPVPACPGDDDGYCQECEEKREFMCEYCSRNVYSGKHKIAFLN